MDEVRRAYGDLAEPYIELFGTRDSVPIDDLALIERHLLIQPGAVLDVGCGPGHLTAHLCARGVDATGIDLVREFVDHARATHPDGRYELASMRDLPVPDESVAGILAWYSLIHVPPEGIGGVLAELRRVMAPGGALVVGFFDGDRVEAFPHKVVTAYRWPLDELSDRLRQAGFREVERQRRAGDAASETRPHAAIAALAV